MGQNPVMVRGEFRLYLDLSFATRGQHMVNADGVIERRQIKCRRIRADPRHAACRADLRHRSGPAHGIEKRVPVMGSW